MHISIQNLSKAFGGRDIFSDFSLEAQAGLRLCVCGPNGCGKSTLLRLIAGVEPVDGGRVIIPKGSRLGFVMQELYAPDLERSLLDFVLEVLPDWSAFWAEWEHAGCAVAAAAAAQTGGRSTIDKAALLRLSQRQAELEHI